LFKDEGRLLTGAEDVDRVYIEKVLPEKMVYNLQALKDFSLFGELKIMLKTVVAVFEKE
jgi:lipopolysaccharide/colanic/teichoic acid biosynthesis glycosyltransferase